jgi:hypothetical protein
MPAVQMLDPYKTREEFIFHAIRAPLTTKAHETWLKTASNLRNLVESLAYHPAMAPKLQ